MQEAKAASCREISPCTLLLLLMLYFVYHTHSGLQRQVAMTRKTTELEDDAPTGRVDFQKQLDTMSAV
jgi:hypothetical protein